jgi:predicted DNA-binding WGR domain protein
VRLEFQTDTRGYILVLEQDLFGTFVLFRRWYGLRNRRGGLKRQVFMNEEDARNEFERIRRLRTRRGYRPTHPLPA